MKLFLSSFRLGNNPQLLADLFGENKTVAIIPNAKDFYEPNYKLQRIQEEKVALAEIGLDATEIDLRDYFGKQNKLEQVLDKFGGVWVVGGNTFILRLGMLQSGFDTWLAAKKSNPAFVYAGYSAGICVLAPSLRGFDLVDNPLEKPEGYPKEVIWEGLEVIDYAIVPHYQSNHPESEAVEKTVIYFKQHNIPHKTLHDGEVIII